MNFVTRNVSLAQDTLRLHAAAATARHYLTAANSVETGVYAQTTKTQCIYIYIYVLKQ